MNDNNKKYMAKFKYPLNDKIAYRVHTYTDDNPYHYYCLVYKNDILISWDISFGIVNAFDFYGLQINACKFNQVYTM